jgi:hypothetical protein
LGFQTKQSSWRAWSGKMRSLAVPFFPSCQQRGVFECKNGPSAKKLFHPRPKLRLCITETSFRWNTWLDQKFIIVINI